MIIWLKMIVSFLKEFVPRSVLVDRSAHLDIFQPEVRAWEISLMAPLAFGCNSGAIREHGTPRVKCLLSIAFPVYSLGPAVW